MGMDRKRFLGPNTGKCCVKQHMLPECCIAIVGYCIRKHAFGHVN